MTKNAPAKSLPPAVIVATATQPPPTKREIMTAMVARYETKIEADYNDASKRLDVNQKDQAETLERLAKSLLPAKDVAALERISGRQTRAVTCLHWRNGNRSMFYLRINFTGSEEDYDRSIDLPRRSLRNMTEAQQALVGHFEKLIIDEKETRQAMSRFGQNNRRNLIADFRKQAIGLTPPSQRVGKLLANADAVKAIDAMRDAILTKGKENEPREVAAAVVA